MTFQKKRLVAVGIAAMLVVALACTALALTLGTRYDAAKAARQAVMDKYGLTPETITLFEEEKTEANGVWTVVFRPWKYNPEAMGVYTVTVAEGKEAVTAWTHDGKEVGEGLESPIWGPEQLTQVMSLERGNYAPVEGEAAAGELLRQLELSAKRDQGLLDSGLDVFVMNILPGPDDVQVDEAVDIAKQAIRAKYGPSEEAMARLEPVWMMFLDYQSREEPVYRVTLKAKGLDEAYEVWVYSPSGKAGSCTWAVEPEDRTLPDGPLKGYEEAVKEYMLEGALDARTPAEKAEIAARIAEAGYGEYLESLAYVAPKEGDVPEADARAEAKKALERERGFTDATLALFDMGASMVEENGERVWRILLKPAPEGTLLQEPQKDRMGKYSVTLSARDGTVKGTSWTLEKERGNTEYTETTWGRAAAYDAQILSWALKLEEAYGEIAARNGIEQDDLATPWPIEDAAARDQLFRDAGFDPNTYPNGLPGEGDVSQEQALKAVKQALKAEFQFTDERLEESTYVASFLVNDPKKPVWCFTIYRIVDGYQDTHAVWVDARTGEIANTEYTSVGNG